MKILLNFETDSFKCIECKIGTNKNCHYIDRVISLTPAVATIDSKSLTSDLGVSFIMDKIHSNAVKKYRSYFGDFAEPNDNFIESIEFLNKKPIKIKYKTTNFLGNKFKINIKSDEVSQKLGFLILGGGILEKNTIGMGYCILDRS